MAGSAERAKPLKQKVLGEVGSERKCMCVWVGVCEEAVEEAGVLGRESGDQSDDTDILGVS